MIDFKNFTIKLIGLIAIILTVIFGMSMTIYFWPFAVAYLVAIIIEPMVKKLYNKYRVPKRLSIVILMTIIYLIIVGIFLLILMKMFKETYSLINILPDIFSKSKEFLTTNIQKVKEIYSGLPDVVSNKIHGIGIGVISNISDILLKFLNSLFDFVLFIPNLIIYLVVMIIATYFLAVDKNSMYEVLEKTLPKKWLDNFVNIIRKSMSSLLKYFKSQLILACISFVELVIAFLIIRQPYPFTISLILAIFDLLPVVGVGTGVIPWIIYCGMTGNISKAISLTVIMFIIMIIRQLTEPKIVSSSIGIKPLLTLFSMYVGFKVFGVMGMIIGPIITIILKDVLTITLETGYIKSMFKEKKEKSIRYFKV